MRRYIIGLGFVAGCYYGPRLELGGNDKDPAPSDFEDDTDSFHDLIIGPIETGEEGCLSGFEDTYKGGFPEDTYDIWPR